MEKVTEGKFLKYQKILLTRQEIFDIVNIFKDRPFDRKYFQLNNIRYKDDEISIFLENIQNSELITTIKIDSHYYSHGDNRGLYLSLKLTTDDAYFYTDDIQSKEYIEIRDILDAILSKAEIEKEKEGYSPPDHWNFRNIY